MSTRVSYDQSTYPQQTLHGWLPIAQIANHLGISTETVYFTVRRASQSNQAWVKLEDLPSRGGRRKWLVDTDAAIFQHHQQRWKSLAKKKKHAAGTHTMIPLSELFWDSALDENPLQLEAPNGLAEWSLPQGERKSGEAPLPAQPQKDHAQRMQALAALFLLVLLHLISIACILKRRKEGKCERTRDE